MRTTFAEFCDLVREAVESLPEPLQPYLENVVVDVFDEPSAADLAQAEEGAADLLGLFVGVPRTHQEYGYAPMNVVKIFRGPHERASRSRRALRQNIRATILHEFAHHFGYTEEDLEPFEDSQGKWLE